MSFHELVEESNGFLDGFSCGQTDLDPEGLAVLSDSGLGVDLAIENRPLQTEVQQPVSGPHVSDRRGHAGQVEPDVVVESILTALLGAHLERKEPNRLLSLGSFNGDGMSHHRLHELPDQVRIAVRSSSAGEDHLDFDRESSGRLCPTWHRCRRPAFNEVEQSPEFLRGALSYQLCLQLASIFCGCCLWSHCNTGNACVQSKK